MKYYICEAHYEVSTNFAMFCENLGLLVFVMKAGSEICIHLVYVT
jgi:hypothetical protein